VTSIETIARASGCAIVRTGERRQGDRVFPEYQVACPDNARALVLLNRLALEDAIESPVIQTLAREHRAYAQAANPQRWQLTFARDIQRAVRQIAYVPDAYQTFRAPEITLEDAEGNCVNQARIVAALGHAARVKARIAPVYDDDGEITHACAQLDTTGRGQFEWAETTIDAAMGEEPRAAARRLGLLPPVSLKNRKVPK
jgi:transglutaminase-like putative cysteine protease